MNIFNIKINSVMTSFLMLSHCVHSMEMDVEQPKTARSNNTSPPSAKLKAQQNRFNTVTPPSQIQFSIINTQHPYATRQQEKKVKQEMLDERKNTPTNLPTTYHASQIRNKTLSLEERYKRQQEEREREQQELQSKYNRMEREVNVGQIKGEIESEQKKRELDYRQYTINKMNSQNQAKIIAIEPNAVAHPYLYPMPQTKATWHILSNLNDNTPYIQLDGRFNQPNNPPKVTQTRPIEATQPDLKKRKTESDNTQKSINTAEDQSSRKYLYADNPSGNDPMARMTFENFLAANYLASYQAQIGYNSPMHALSTPTPTPTPTPPPTVTIDPVNTKVTITPEIITAPETIPQLNKTEKIKTVDKKTINEIINLIYLNQNNDSVNTLDDSLTNEEFLKFNSPSITEFEINDNKNNNQAGFEIFINKKFNISINIMPIFHNDKIKIGTDSLIIRFLENLKHIKFLSLKNMKEITDNSLYFNSFPESIDHIEIYNCPHLTDISVGNILSSNPNLKYLSIQKCPHIRSNWQGIFSKYDLYKLKNSYKNSINSSKILVEKNNYEILRNIVKKTIQDMNISLNNSNIMQQDIPTLSLEESNNLRIYPVEIELSEHIPTDGSTKHLNQNDVANNILMNFVDTFSNSQKIILSDTEVTLTGLFHLQKLTNLNYLDARHTSLRLKTRVYENKTSIDSLLYTLNKSIRTEFITDSYVDSFFHTT